MGRYDLDEMEIGEDEQILNPKGRRFAVQQADQPKRSPIRRRDRWRPEEEIRPRAKKNDKKIQLKLKYSWQGE